MSSWWSPSWLPSLPSIDLSIPSNIQKRFISFALRQTLGRFVKPGQLDIQQVDSQIGSGYVQVRDVELDNDAINSFIAGLPLELHDGSVAKVTTQIPWPNPLTSSIGLSLESLHLTFNLAPNIKEGPSSQSLADSVASVAETFIHDELSPHEESTLRHSFHPDLSSSNQSLQENVPGGLDPFLSDLDEQHDESEPAGVSIFATLVEKLLSRFHFDAKDTKVTIINPGHASFTFTIPEIRYATEEPTSSAAGSRPATGVVGDGAIRTLTISNVQVSTRCLRLPIPGSTTPTSVSPIKLTSYPTQLTGRVPSTSALALDSSIHSDSSDLDEDTHMMMSQSIVGLPPRPLSPSSSVASSLYQSAVSSTKAETVTLRPAGSPTQGTLPQSPSYSPPTPPFVPEAEGILEETILSLSSEPIVISLTTPPIHKPTEQSSKRQGKLNESGHKQDTGLKFDIRLGFTAIALRSDHIRELMNITNAWGSHSHSPPTPTKTQLESSDNGSSIGDELRASMHMGGVVLLLLPSQSQPLTNSNKAMVEFFSRPVLPPQLGHGYLRIHLDSLSVSLSTQSLQESLISRNRRILYLSRSTMISMRLSEFSIFAFQSNSSDGRLSADPIIITDPYLTSQYSSDHVQPDLRDAELRTILPIFDVADWTSFAHRATTTKLSQWRARPSHHRSSSSQDSPLRKTQQLSPSSSRSYPFQMESPPRRIDTKYPVSPTKRHDSKIQSSALVGKITLLTRVPLSKNQPRRLQANSASNKVEVDLAPLHLFVDAGLLLSQDDSGANAIISFLDALVDPNIDEESSFDTDQEQGSDISEDESEGDTPPGTLWIRNKVQNVEQERRKERQRLERLVIEDLDLKFDYSPGKQQSASHSHKAIKKKRKHADSTIVVNIPVLRVQVRTPPPPDKAPRSGAVVLDIHDLHIHPGGSFQSHDTTSVKFTEQYAIPQPIPSDDHAGNPIMSAEWSRVVIAYCPVVEDKARAILSLGSNALSGVPEHGGIDIPESPPTRQTLRNSRLLLSKSDPPELPSDFSTTAISIGVPSVFVTLSKPLVDGLQLWADDLSQLLERAFRGLSAESTPSGSEEASMIGSRFFAKTRRKRGSGTISSSISAEQTDSKSQTIVKVLVDDIALRLLLPREDGVVRPFDVIASGLDILLELKPEGKDETVCTLSISDLNVVETSVKQSRCSFVSLTLPTALLPDARPPSLKLRFTSLIVPGTTAKESKVKLTLSGLTCNVYPDFKWVSDLERFAKSPPGAFESVVPSERTSVSMKINDTSIRGFGPSHPGAVVLYLGEIDFHTVLIGDLPETSFHLIVQQLCLYLSDDLSHTSEDVSTQTPTKPGRVRGSSFWKDSGYALLAELSDFDFKFLSLSHVQPSSIKIDVDKAGLRLHLCADTATALASLITDITSSFPNPPEPEPSDNSGSSHPSLQTKGPSMAARQQPTPISEAPSRNLFDSLDEHAFRRLPEVGSAPDMINDDLPTNLDYLDESFGAAAGLRELTDEDLEDFGTESSEPEQPGVVFKYGGETIRMLQPDGLHIVEHYYDTLPPDANDEGAQYGETTLRVRVRHCDVSVLLYDGYDWGRTRSIIEDEEKRMRRRLAKIRQLVADGQMPDPSVEETNTLLFNSVYIGLEHNIDELEPGALIAAIDDELDDDTETASQSSWQSLRPQPPSQTKQPARRIRHKAKRRSKRPSIEFQLSQLFAEVDNYKDHPQLASRILVTARDVEILDNIKTSTWRKFLTDLQRDTKGNIRETDSNMARVELRKVYPVPGNPAQEARLRMKFLPLRLHVDQDALDFLKKFFSFKDPEAAPPETSEPTNEIFFQQAEVFPVDLKLDYKPRRVDYRALRDGKTIELMNFFHFDGAEMTLRHITLTGITGWARVFDLLNDLWTPDVKATQLVDVISGVAPIRSVVNVGSGVADLVLLPIAQYRRDGRVVRGLQKGTTAFVKSTAIEAVKLGARLATGTQVILEQAENVLGGQFKDPITAEALQAGYEGIGGNVPGEEEEDEDLISRYAVQPVNVQEGVKSAYSSLSKNFHSAAQTILAVPMEVYERSGNEGTVRAVVRAVPIAVLKPMIGASEAVSKTLLGLHNTLDPSIRQENEAKYKQR